MHLQSDVVVDPTSSFEGVQRAIGQAQTGTGKTAAFGIPILEKVRKEIKHPQTLVLCPTRELAVQAADPTSSFEGVQRARIAGDIYSIINAMLY